MNGSYSTEVRLHWILDWSIRSVLDESVRSSDKSFPKTNVLFMRCVYKTLRDFIMDFLWCSVLFFIAAKHSEQNRRQTWKFCISFIARNIECIQIWKLSRRNKPMRYAGKNGILIKHSNSLQLSTQSSLQLSCNIFWLK